MEPDVSNPYELRYYVLAKPVTPEDLPGLAIIRSGEPFEMLIHGTRAEILLRILGSSHAATIRDPGSEKIVSEIFACSMIPGLNPQLQLDGTRERFSLTTTLDAIRLQTEFTVRKFPSVGMVREASKQILKRPGLAHIFEEGDPSTHTWVNASAVGEIESSHGYPEHQIIVTTRTVI